MKVVQTNAVIDETSSSMTAEFLTVVLVLYGPRFFVVAASARGRKICRNGRRRTEYGQEAK
jgi:hypothetical protein